MSDYVGPSPFQFEMPKVEIREEYLSEFDSSRFDLWVTGILFSKLGDMSTVTHYLNVYQRRIHSLLDAREMSLDGLCQVLDSLMVEPNRSSWSLRGTGDGYVLEPGSKPQGFPVFHEKICGTPEAQLDDDYDVCDVCERAVNVNSNCTACCDELLNKIVVTADVAVPIYFSANCVHQARKLLPDGSLRSVDGFMVYVAHVKVTFPAVAMFTDSPRVILDRIISERKSFLESYRSLLTNGEFPVLPDSVDTRGDLVLTEYISRFGTELGWLVFVSVAGVPWSLIFEAKGASLVVEKFWGSKEIESSELFSWLAKAVDSTTDIHGWSMDLAEGSLEIDDLLVYRSNYSPHSLELLEEMGFGFIVGDSLMTETTFLGYWKDNVLWDYRQERLCICCFMALDSPSRLCNSCDSLFQSLPGMTVRIDSPKFVSCDESVSSLSEPSSGSTEDDPAPPVRHYPVTFFDELVGEASGGLNSKSGTHEWHAGGCNVASANCTCWASEVAMASSVANAYVSDGDTFGPCASLPMVNRNMDSFYYPYKVMYHVDTDAFGVVDGDDVECRIGDVPEIMAACGMVNHAVGLLFMAGLMSSFDVCLEHHESVFPAVKISWFPPLDTDDVNEVMWFVIPFEGRIPELRFRSFPRRTGSSFRTVGLRSLCLNPKLKVDLAFPDCMYQKMLSLIQEKEIDNAATLVRKVFNRMFMSSNRYYMLEVEEGISTTLQKQCLIKASKAVEEFIIPVPMVYYHGCYSVDLFSACCTVSSKDSNLMVALYRLDKAGKLYDEFDVPTVYYDHLTSLVDDGICEFK